MGGFAEGFSVPAATVAAIQAKLDAAERKRGVKVLYAVESGSRSGEPGLPHLIRLFLFADEV